MNFFNVISFFTFRVKFPDQDLVHQFTNAIDTVEVVLIREEEKEGKSFYRIKTLSLERA